jgi:hypothetical protein
MYMTPGRKRDLGYMKDLLDQKQALLLVTQAENGGLVAKMKESKRKRATKAASGEARVMQMETIQENKEKKEVVLWEKETAKRTREEIRIAQAEWKIAKEEVFPRDIRVFR